MFHPLIRCKNYSYTSLHQSVIEQNDDLQMSKIAIYCSQQCKQRGGLLKGAVNTHKDEQRHRQERKLSHAPAFNVLKEIVKTRTFPEKI